MVNETRVMREALDTAIADALAQMDEDQQEQFKAVCAAVLAAYVHDDVHCLVIIGRSQGSTVAPFGTPVAIPGLDVTHISSINASDIQAAQIIAGAANQVSAIVMADAPPRELFS